MTQFLQFAVLGIGVGVGYVLLANGLIVIYRGSGVLNFAQGAYAMAAAFTFYELHVNDHWSFVWAFIVTLVMTAAIGAATHLVIMRRLRHASALTRLIATLGILGLTEGIATLFYGSNVVTVPSSLPTSSFIVHGIFVRRTASSAARARRRADLALSFASRHTMIGLATSAVAENQRAAARCGWSPDLMATLNWSLGAALAAVAGILIAPLSGVTVTNLTLIVVAAMAAAADREVLLVLVDVAGRARHRHPAVRAGVVLSDSGLDPCCSVPRDHRRARRPRAGAAAQRRRLDRLPMSARPHRGPGMHPARRRRLLGLSARLSARSGSTRSRRRPHRDHPSFHRRCHRLHRPAVPRAVRARRDGGLDRGSPRGPATGRSSWLPSPVHRGRCRLASSLGLPALRTRGVNLAIATLGLGAALQSQVLAEQPLTGGTLGTRSAPRASSASISTPSGLPGAMPRLPSSCSSVAFLAVATSAAAAPDAGSSQYARTSAAAAALGVNVFAAKLYAFGLSAALAAMGGILIAFQMPTVTFYPSSTCWLALVRRLAVIGGLARPSARWPEPAWHPAALARSPRLLRNDLDNCSGCSAVSFSSLVLLQDSDGLVSPIGGKCFR